MKIPSNRTILGLALALSGIAHAVLFLVIDAFFSLPRQSAFAPQITSTTLSIDLTPQLLAIPKIDEPDLTKTEESIIGSDLVETPKPIPQPEPEQIAPEQTAPKQTIPEQITPEQITPENVVQQPLATKPIIEAPITAPIKEPDVPQKETTKNTSKPRQLFSLQQQIQSAVNAEFNQAVQDTDIVKNLANDNCTLNDEKSQIVVCNKGSNTLEGSDTSTININSQAFKISEFKPESIDAQERNRLIALEQQLHAIKSDQNIDKSIVAAHQREVTNELDYIEAQQGAAGLLAPILLTGQIIAEKVKKPSFYQSSKDHVFTTDGTTKSIEVTSDTLDTEKTTDTEIATDTLRTAQQKQQTQTSAEPASSTTLDNSVNQPQVIPIITISPKKSSPDNSTHNQN